MLVEPVLLRPEVFADLPGVFAAFTTRHFAAPNEAAATAALQALAQEEGFAAVASAVQVHGAAVAVVRSGGRRADHDGLVTDRAGLLLSVFAADCALVLLADPEARVVGACHSGWRGTVAGVTAE
ncbi:MAG: laccase domain-containing protein, partial [Rhodothermales bacterium]|nr:laccase domain-containing protein [Rhodothermales bacterium]